MSLFTYSLAGGSFILIGAWEALVSSASASASASSSSSSPSQTLNLAPPSSSSQPQPQSTTKTKTTPSSSSITFIAISLFSFFFILNSLISLIDALNSKDNTGLALQLQVIVMASLFFFYSVLGLLTHFKNSFYLPPSILNLLCLFAFGEEFILFYLLRKDPSGIENRYFDLLLVPIGVCVFSTILELKTPKSSNYARLGRGIGLILQGTWIVQMGFSFYSDMMTHGCSLHGKSRGNYTIKCKGHPEYHRGRAIATLQFNCHLSLLVVLIVGVYSILCKNHGNESMRYRPLGAEMQQLDNQAQFTLDSDDDDVDFENTMKEESRSTAIQKVPEVGVNGYDSHH